MQKKIRKIITSYKNSKYFLPITLVVLFIVLSGALVSIFELYWKADDEFLDITDGLWWAIITFSTTGYGDKVPDSPGGKIIAAITIFIGIAAMSFLSGALASVFVERNSRARRGLLDFPKLKDHFVICGWKGHMKDILLDIIDIVPDISADSILIISNISTEKIEELKETDRLKGLRFVRGDYFSESVLKRGNVRRARKVLVLSDTFESSADSEVDSKTVMTVLTVKAMARDVYVCAELLDKKYESYLKQAMCDEIIFSRDFSRRMLATTTATDGLSHIMFELLSYGKSKSKLSTFKIAPEFIGKQYSEYKSAIRAFKNITLFGILENAGSPNTMKIEALREAQKTSDVSLLVNNLKKVKGIEANHPIFLPDDNYIIQKYSRAIALEKL